MSVEVSRLGLLQRDAVHSGECLLKLWMKLMPKLGAEPINHRKPFLLNLYTDPPVSTLGKTVNFYDYIHENVKFQSIKPTFMKSKMCLFKLTCVSI